MLVLGIETSCDETAAAVVKDGKKILSSIVSSSLRFHRKYGGVVPEIASRMHVETISMVVEDALSEAGVGIKDIGLIAVTDRPGLPGSLLTGKSFAAALSFARNIPLVEVNHLYAHIYANFLNGNKSGAPRPKGQGSLLSRKQYAFIPRAKARGFLRRIRFPFVGLVVSGGHTSLFRVKNFKKIKVLGTTLDDACGETFDKVAKILKLGYPGGPIIERLAKHSGERKIKFRCGEEVDSLDFSFSGIKTAVLYHTKSHEPRAKSEIAYSFQEAAIDSLIKKSLLACKRRKIRQLVVGGGVAANNRLRQRLDKEAGSQGIKVYFPPKELCMDNAAMVAGIGYWVKRR